MRKADVDYILGRMLESHDNVSDLNFTVAKPPQVEVSGELTPVMIDPRLEKLTPFQTEMLALHLMQCDRRLSQQLISQGSCDCSYAVIGRARFRVNVFQHQLAFLWIGNAFHALCHHIQYFTPGLFCFFLNTT